MDDSQWSGERASAKMVRPMSGEWSAMWGERTMARGDGIVVYRGGHKWERGRGHRVSMDGEQEG